MPSPTDSRPASHSLVLASSRLRVFASSLLLLAGCLSGERARHDADRVTDRIVADAQHDALGRTERIEVRTPEATLRRQLLIDQALPISSPASFGTRSIVPIPQFPDPAYFKEPIPQDPAPWMDRAGAGSLQISLADAVQIAARNSRTFQTEKEKVFLAALALDLQRDAFRGTWTSVRKSEAVADLSSGRDVATLDNTADLSLAKKFKNGMQVTAAIGLNLVRLLTGDVASALGQFADASVTIPLLRGAGTFVVTEPLRQAERDSIYAIFTFERFKQTFSVDVARAYLTELQNFDAAHNAEESYKRLVASTRRARRLADAGRLPQIQVDQTQQDELRARDRWIAALQADARSLDQLRVLLGLPPDADVKPDPAVLERLVADAEAMRRPPEEAANPAPAATAAADAPVELEPPDRTHRGPLEFDERAAIELALARRLDLRVAVARIDDAQRKVAVGADDLKPDLTLLGQMNLGKRLSAGQATGLDTSLHAGRGTYTGSVELDPFPERDPQRNTYRTRLIDMEKAVRTAQETEDQVKSDVRDTLRTLLSARESVRTQERSLELARRRVESVNLFLQAGRAEIRDLLDAQESLISAENARTSAVVRYRLAELELQRDLGVLDVTVDGLWKEFDPREMSR